MLDEKKTLRTHPSLLPLRTALIVAERESHPRPLQTITDEHRASQLIKRMKTEYNKPLPFSYFIRRSPKVLSSNTKSGDFVLREHLQEVIGMYV